MNNLLLNVGKTTELIIDFGKKEERTHTPVYISGAEVEQVNSFRFLGISITKNLSWTPHISHPGKERSETAGFLKET